MKQSFKCLLVILCSLIVFQATAQDDRWKLGIHAGLNLSTAEEKADYILGSNSIKPGFQAGVTAAFNVNYGFQLQSGLSFSTKGVKQTQKDVWIGTGNPPVTTMITNTTLMYVQLPLKLAWQFDIGEQFKITPNAGIYLAYGVGGKQVVRSSTTNNAMEDRKVTYKSFDDTDGYERFDNGISFGATIQFNKYTLAADYEMGAANIGRNPNDNQKYIFKNRNIGITLGYIF